MSENESQEINPLRSKKQMALPFILFGISSFILIISFVFYLKPQYQNLQIIKEEIKTNEVDNNLLQQQYSSMKQRIEQEEEEEKELIDQDIVIPSEFDITEFLANIEYFTHESKGYKLKQLGIEGPLPMDLYPGIGELTMNISIDASTTNKLISLIEELEEDKQIFLIENFSIDELSRFSNQEVSQDITIKTYYMLQLSNPVL